MLNEVRSCLYHYPPWVNITQNSTEMNGFMIDLLNYLSRSTNISYPIVKTIQPEHGKLQDNGRWTGAIGILQNNESELCFLPFAPTEKRGSVISFSLPFLNAYSSILSGKPKFNKRPMFSYLDLLGYKEWIILLITFVAVVWVTSKLEKAKRREISFYKYFWAYLGSLLNRPTTYEPRTLCGRLVFMLWFFGVLVVTTGMGSQIKAAFAVSDGINSILVHTSIQPMVPKGTVFQEYFEYSTDTTLISVWKRIREKNGVQDLEVFRNKETLRRVNNGETVLISEYYSLLHIINALKCGGSKYNGMLHMANERYFSQPLTLGLRKKLPEDFVELLNRRVSFFEATVQLGPLLRRISYTSLNCLRNNFATGDPNAISWKDMEATIFISIFGFTLALTSFIGELHVL